MKTIIDISGDAFDWQDGAGWVPSSATREELVQAAAAQELRLAVLGLTNASHRLSKAMQSFPPVAPSIPNSTPGLPATDADGLQR